MTLALLASLAILLFALSNQFGEPCQAHVGLLVRADADSQAVAPAGIVHVADENSGSLQFFIQAARVRCVVAAPDEVGLRVDAGEAQSAKFCRESRSRRQDYGAGVVEPRAVVDCG